MNHKNVFQAPTLEPPIEVISPPKIIEQTTSITSGITIIPLIIATTSTYTTVETPAADIWVTVGSVIAVFIVLAVIGLSIFLYIRKKHSTTKKELQRSFHSERSYDLPYRDQVYNEYEELQRFVHSKINKDLPYKDQVDNEYEEYEDGLYENYQN